MTAPYRPYAGEAAISVGGAGKEGRSYENVRFVELTWRVEI